MPAKTKRPRTAPLDADPRRLEADALEARLTELLDADTKRGERTGDRQAHPDDWPAWTDNWIIGLTD